VDLQWFGLVGNHDWAARTWDLFSRILARSYSTVAIRKDATSLTTLKEKLIKIGCRKGSSIALVTPQPRWRRSPSACRRQCRFLGFAA
jgi:hypothetical protein